MNNRVYLLTKTITNQDWRDISEMMGAFSNLEEANKAKAHLLKAIPSEEELEDKGIMELRFDIREEPLDAFFILEGLKSVEENLKSQALETLKTKTLESAIVIANQFYEQFTVQEIQNETQFYPIKELILHFKSPELETLMIQRLQSHEEEIRAFACNALGLLKNQNALEYIKNCLKSEEPEADWEPGDDFSKVVTEAVLAMIKISGEKIVILTECLTIDASAAFCAYMLRTLDETQAIPSIIENLKHLDFSSQGYIYSLKLITHFQAKQAIPIIKDLLKNTDSSIPEDQLKQLMLVMVLCKLQAEGALDDLKHLQKSQPNNPMLLMGIKEMEEGKPPFENMLW